MSQYPVLFILISVVALSSLQASPTRIPVRTLPLSKRGDLIELGSGHFFRLSAIREIIGKIDYNARRDGPNKWQNSPENRSFPLTADGIKALKETKRSTLIDRFHGGAKVEDFEFEVVVTIQIDEDKWQLFEISGADPLAEWDRFEDAANEAVRSFDSLVSLAANGEQASTGQPATRPVSKSEGSDKPQPEAEGRSR